MDKKKKTVGRVEMAKEIASMVVAELQRSDLSEELLLKVQKVVEGNIREWFVGYGVKDIYVNNP
jgi:hypothetical protein